ncbi:MAG: zinc-ribbon domain-containing protein [Coriobacteriales bacterium]|nr:zinc-ribbon domain-containing protein [Coriobacteriales bacterium]
MRCPACNSNNDDSAQFCTHCGHPLTSSAKTTAASKKGPLVAALTALAVVLVGTCVWIVVGGIPKVTSQTAPQSEPSAQAQEPASVEPANEAPASYIESTLGTEQSYQTDYLWQARGASRSDGEPYFRVVVGEGIPNGAVVGTCKDDFNADGSDELLVVTWENDTLHLAVHADDGSVLGASDVLGNGVAGITRTTSFPLGNKGVLDVLVYDHQPFVQYWSTGAGIGDGIGWNVTEFVFDDEGLHPAREVFTAGSYFDAPEIQRIASEVAELGLPTDAIPTDENGTQAYEFLATPYADHVPELHVVTRATASSDDFYAGDYKSSEASVAQGILNSKQDEWSELHPMGTFSITQG